MFTQERIVALQIRREMYEQLERAKVGFEEAKAAGDFVRMHSFAQLVRQRTRYMDKLKV
jgi:hypothetical protein